LGADVTGVRWAAILQRSIGTFSSQSPGLAAAWWSTRFRRGRTKVPSPEWHAFTRLLP
jgi:hypothetical protein